MILVTCMLAMHHAQATWIADVIALKNEFTNKGSKPAEKPDNRLIIIKQENQSPASMAAWNFAKGFGKGFATYALVSAGKNYGFDSDQDISKFGSHIMGEELTFVQHAILLSGVPSLTWDVIDLCDILFAKYAKESSCPRCLSRQDAINAGARVAGSLTAVAMLYYQAYKLNVVDDLTLSH